MLFEDIYEEVQNQFGATDLFRVKLWTNLAYHDIISRRLWAWSERVGTISIDATTPAASYSLVASASLPDLRTVKSIQYRLGTAGGSLRYVESDLFDEIVRSAPAIYAAPTIYTIGGGTPEANAAAVVAGGAQILTTFPLGLSATASQTLVVRYFRGAASLELTADTNVPMIPGQHIAALIYKAVAIGLEMDDQQQQAARFDERAERRIQAMAFEDSGMRDGDDHALVEEPTPPPAALAAPRAG